jgi:hypothetical protein
MKRKLHGKADPMERQIELALHHGAFIRDGECFSFVSGLEEVAATIGKLIATDPARAAALYESFLAATSLLRSVSRVLLTGMPCEGR